MVRASFGSHKLAPQKQLGGVSSMNDPNIAQVPWWVTLVGMVLTSLGTILAARFKSKSTKEKTQADAQTALIEQTVERQRQLDERQKEMLDWQTAEIGRLRDEILFIRKAQDAEHLKNMKLEDEILSLKNENDALRKENSELKLEIAELKNSIGKLSRN
jgi:chromosome segregation ATPase